MSSSSTSVGSGPKCVEEGCNDTAEWVCAKCSDDTQPWFLCERHNRKYHKSRNTQNHYRMTWQQYQQEDQFIRLVNHQAQPDEFERDQQENLFFGAALSAEHKDPTLELGNKYHALSVRFQASKTKVEVGMISFIAPTGSGKSLLLRWFVHSGSDSDSSLPLAANHGDLVSCSADLHAYFTHWKIALAPPQKGKRVFPIICIDSEGLRGTDIPKQAGFLGKLWPFKSESSKDRLTKFRARMVEMVYPRLLYMFSDVMLYPFIGSPAEIQSYGQDLLEFSAIASARTVNSAVLPSLCIIFNKRAMQDCHDYLQKEGEKEEASITRATNAWIEQHGDLYDQLKLVFREVKVIHIPNCVEYPREALTALTQLKRLTQRLVSECVAAREAANKIQRQPELFSNMWSMANRLSTHPEDNINLFSLFLNDPEIAAAGAEKWGHLLTYWRALMRHYYGNVDAASAKLRDAVPLLLRNRWGTSDVARGYRDVWERELAALEEEVKLDLRCTATQEFHCAQRGVISVRCELYHRSHLGQPHKSTQTYFTTKPSSAWYTKLYNGQDYVSGPCVWDGAFETSFTAPELAQPISEAYDRNQEPPSPSEYLRALDLALLLKIAKQQPEVADKICLVCVWNSPTVPLVCGHCLCPGCFGKYTNVHPSRCPLCKEQTVRALQEVPKSAGIRVLSLDGGGVRGVIQLVILAQIERLIGLPIAKLFDLIVGTSAGGILALYLTSKASTVGTAKLNSPQSGIDLIKTIAKTVFGEPTSSVWKFLSLLFGSAYSKYSGEKLSEVLSRNMKESYNKPLRGYASPAPVVAVTMVKVASSSLVVASSASGAMIEGDIGCFTTVGQACMGTSAAPTYFPHVTINDKVYVDGGMRANCPANKAIDIAQSLWPEQTTDMVVSIGTGLCNAQSESGGSILEAIGLIVNWLTDSEDQSRKAEERMQRELPSRPYIRVNVDIDRPYDLDVCDAAAIEAMIVASQYVCERRGICDEIAGRLIAQLLFVNSNGPNIAKQFKFAVVSRLPLERPVESVCEDGDLYYTLQRNDDPEQTAELGSERSSTIDLDHGTYSIAFMLRTKYGAFPLSGFPMTLNVNPSTYTD